MATYPCDPLPLLPPGTAVMEANGNRHSRTYHFLGGEPLVQSGDWAIISLAPPPDPAKFETDAMLIRHFLDHERGFCIAKISCCGMGAAFVRFAHACDIDTAIANSPYFVSDSVLRVLRHDRGIWHDADFMDDNHHAPVDEDEPMILDMRACLLPVTNEYTDSRSVMIKRARKV
uniref:DUF7597 domain-containing protein n=1 Tax=Aegilops tauschii TaxID=37682 RepID=M8ANT6_AEGTA